MDDRLNLTGHDGASVSGLASDDLYNAPVNKAPLAYAGTSEAAETVPVQPRLNDSLPARRIEFRYWAAALAFGLAIWAAILIWLL